jgi:hypothetical protein
LEINRSYQNHSSMSSYERYERVRAEQQMRNAIALGDLILRALSKLHAVLKAAGKVLLTAMPRPSRRDPKSNVIPLSVARRR